jgi:hypothetical protein
VNKSEIDPFQVQDELELNIQKVIHENQIDIMEKITADLQCSKNAA